MWGMMHLIKRKSFLWSEIRQILSLPFLRLALSNPPEIMMLSGLMTIICFIPFITAYAMMLEPESGVIITQDSYLVRTITRPVTRLRKYVTAIKILTKKLEWGKIQALIKSARLLHLNICTRIIWSSGTTCSGLIIIWMYGVSITITMLLNQLNSRIFF